MKRIFYNCWTIRRKAKKASEDIGQFPDIADKIEIYNQKRAEQKKDGELPAIELKNLIIDFGETLAVDDVSFKIEKGSLVTLLGPSGSGKTTALNAIAGLLTPTSGKILFQGNDVTKYSPQKRKLGFVFQNYALYPHLSVYSNIAFPLKNDGHWKNSIYIKRELAKLRVAAIYLKRLGASESEIKSLYDTLSQYFYLKEDTYYNHESLLINSMEKYELAKSQYDLVKIHKNAQLVSLSKSTLKKLNILNEETLTILSKAKVKSDEMKAFQPDHAYQTSKYKITKVKFKNPVSKDAALLAKSDIEEKIKEVETELNRDLEYLKIKALVFHLKSLKTVLYKYIHFITTKDILVKFASETAVARGNYLAIKTKVKKPLFGENSTFSLEGIKSTFGFESKKPALTKKESTVKPVVKKTGFQFDYDAYKVNKKILDDAKSEKILIPLVMWKKHKNIKNELNKKYNFENIMKNNRKQKIILFSDQEKEQIAELSKDIISLKNAIHRDVMEVANRVEIVQNLQKKPTKLSGGQQQRVSIARAIVKKPKILLMDEPLSNLDAKLRVSTRQWIKNIQQSLGITTVFVTHDQEEAMSISDVIICMSTAKVQQSGTPLELYNNPANEFVATFLGIPEMSLIPATVKEGNVYVLGKKIDNIMIPEKDFGGVDIGVRGEDFKVKEIPTDKTLAADVISVENFGKDSKVVVRVHNIGIINMLLGNEYNYVSGDKIYFELPHKKLHVFDTTTKMRIGYKHI